jgi:hypothetical protein
MNKRQVFEPADPGCVQPTGTPTASARNFKRIVLITALLLGSAISAYADTDIWRGRGSRADMMTAAGTCRQQFGLSPRAHSHQPRACLTILCSVMVDAVFDETHD